MKDGALRTRLSYASSEVAGQLIFCVVSFYLLKFYTDVYGISAFTAGAILLLARCVDAFDAPVWGIIFDKTSSRWGKSRPWFLWLCLPFALSGVLTFSTPSLGAMGKVIYAAVTYVCCSVLYTGINTPVTAILSALTCDSGERVTLTTYRMFGSKLGVLLVNLTILPLVAVFGHGNNRKGFMLVMPLYAVGTVVLYLISFRNLKETACLDRKRLSVAQSLQALKGNGPWLIIFISSLFFWIAFIARISSAPFFFQYVLKREQLVSVANSLDVVSLASILFMPVLCRRFGKGNIWVLSLLGSVLAQAFAYLGVGDRSTPIVLVAWIAGFLASGIAMAMPFSIISDSIDYGEWKNGVRATGLLTAMGVAFCLKAGSGLGGALPAWILGIFGYVPNVKQTARSLTGIEISCLWLPAVAYGLAAIPVFLYRRYETMETVVQRDLEERRRVAALVSSSL